ncbi:MAG: hypothetical protein JOY54_20395 [Acidobacteriaceae bacterium]|nr:hypothetical protein [Acidobacteriaceae bacterium]
MPYTTIVLIIAALYVAWVFYSRYESNKRAEQALAAKEEAQRKRVIDEVYGSGEIRFQNFSADNGSLRRGETTELCYGVENATSVKLDPPVEAIKPMYHHCIEVAPKKTTTYTITAFDAKGNHKSLSLTIQVR